MVIHDGFFLVGKSPAAPVRRTSTPIQQTSAAATSGTTAQAYRPTAAHSAGPTAKKARTSRSPGRSRSFAEATQEDFPTAPIFHFLHSYDHFMSTPTAENQEFQDYPEDGADLPPGCLGLGCLGFAPPPPTSRCDQDEASRGQKVLRQKQLFAAVSTFTMTRTKIHYTPARAFSFTGHFYFQQFCIAELGEIRDEDVHDPDLPPSDNAYDDADQHALTGVEVQLSPQGRGRGSQQRETISPSLHSEQGSQARQILAQYGAPKRTAAPVIARKSARAASRPAPRPAPRGPPNAAPGRQSVTTAAWEGINDRRAIVSVAIGKSSLVPRQTFDVDQFVLARYPMDTLLWPSVVRAKHTPPSGGTRYLLSGFDNVGLVAHENLRPMNILEMEYFSTLALRRVTGALYDRATQSFLQHAQQGVQPPLLPEGAAFLEERKEVWRKETKKILDKRNAPEKAPKKSVTKVVVKRGRR